MNKLAWLLDNSIRIPIINYRIGIDAIIGLIPGVGDAAGLLVSSIIVIQAIRLGAPSGIIMRMLFNVAVEGVVGMIPVVGDLFDATFKANARNVAMLNQAFGTSQKGAATSKSGSKGAIVAGIATVLGSVVLIAGGGIALFWWMISRLPR